MIERNPKDVEALTNRGKASASKKEYAKAIGDYSEAIRLDPRDPALWAVRAEAWKSTGEFDKAIADYSEAIRLNPFNAFEPCWRSAWHLRRNSTRRSTTIAKRFALIRNIPRRTQGAAWPGRKRKSMTTPLRTIPKRFASILRTTSITASAFAWGAKKSFDKAIADYSTAIRIEPANSLYYCVRAFVWFERKEHDKSIADYTEAIRIDPKPPPAIGAEHSSGKL